MISRASVGDAIADFRTERGLSQEMLADRAGVSVHTLRSWEQGKAAPSILSVHALEEALNITANQLLVRADELGGQK